MSDKQTLTKRIADVISKVYFLMILVGLPLYFDKKFYTAMIPAKAHCYWVIAMIMAILIMVVLILAVLQQQSPIRYSLKLDVLDMALLGYGGAVLISYILSKNKHAAYYGSGGFYVGVLTIITSIIFYFFVSRTLNSSRWMWIIIFLLNACLFIWIICDTISIDLFGMHENLGYQKFSYYACLGQMDSVTGYLCLILPVMIVFFLDAKKTTIWQYIVLLLGMTAMTGIRTDGVYIGMTVCGIFLFPYALGNMVRFLRLLWVGLLWGVGITFYSLCSVWIPDRIGTDMGVSGILIRYWGGVVLVILCGIWLLLVRCSKFKMKEIPIRVIGRLCAVVLVGALVLFFVDCVVSLMQGEVLWGNGRGDIWLNCLELYKQYDGLQKLFGVGPTAMAMDLSQLVAWGNVNVVNAHNDFLEQLVSIGCVGLITYCVIWIILIVQFVNRNRNENKWSMERTAFFMALMAYMGQSIVGNPYSLIVPIMYLMFTLYRNEELRCA